MKFTSAVNLDHVLRHGPFVCHVDSRIRISVKPGNEATAQVMAQAIGRWNRLRLSNVTQGRALSGGQKADLEQPGAALQTV